MTKKKGHYKAAEKSNCGRNSTHDASSLHSLTELPAGKRVQDVLQQFSDVQSEVGPLGTPCTVCPSCSKAFSAARKPRMSIKIYPVHFPVPVAFLYRLCGVCASQYRAGGTLKDGVLAAVERFMDGGEVGA